MKTKSSALITILATGLILNAGAAYAAIVNYVGNINDMNTVSIGQTGTLSSANSGGLLVNDIQGSLPSNSMITFTYNFGGDLLSGSLNSGSSYDYLLAGDNYNGGALNQAPSNTYYSFGTINGNPSTSLVVASAQIDATTDTGMTSITNNSAGLATFASIFTGLIAGANNLTITYSVSAVPLPAALPLFGLGLSALGFGAWRRKRARAA